MLKNKIGTTLIIISFMLLVPGVMLPMFNIRMSSCIKADVARFSTEGLNKSQSILETVNDLLKNDRIAVGLLIFFFSVCVPVIKGILLLIAKFQQDRSLAKRLIKFVNNIAKWSMADVFVVAIFLSFLATHGKVEKSTQHIKVFGSQIKVIVAGSVDSSLGPGFYFFLGYCIVSLFSLYFVDWKP